MRAATGKLEGGRRFHIRRFDERDLIVSWVCLVSGQQHRPRAKAFLYSCHFFSQHYLDKLRCEFTLKVVPNLNPSGFIRNRICFHKCARWYYYMDKLTLIIVARLEVEFPSVSFHGERAVHLRVRSTRYKKARSTGLLFACHWRSSSMNSDAQVCG